MKATHPMNIEIYIEIDGIKRFALAIVLKSKNGKNVRNFTTYKNWQTYIKEVQHDNSCRH
jgi:hypothetical protein